MTLRLTLHCQIKDEAGFEAIRKDLPAFVEANEPGTLEYQWQRSGDHVMLTDEYADADAFVRHFHNNTENGLLDRCMAALDIQSVHAVGDLNVGAREILTQLGATEYESVAGFRRQAAAKMV